MMVLLLLLLSSLCAGIKNYCPDGIHLVIGDVPATPFGASPVGSEEHLSKCFLLSQLICACKVTVIVMQDKSLTECFSCGRFFKREECSFAECTPS